MRRTRLLAVAGLLALTVFSGTVLASASKADGETANVILIVTDDQRYDELSSMPNVRSLIAAEGVRFDRAYVTYPLCCPSRSSLLTGLYAHNHDVKGNSPPAGGWGRFEALHESSALPVRVQSAGYRTGFAGKYMNGYMRGLPDPPRKAPGWDFWAAKTSADNYLDFYYDYDLAFSPGTGEPVEYLHHGFAPTDYMTDVTGGKALSFLEERASEPGVPFMLAFWPGGPHFPFEPAPRHWNLLDSRYLKPVPAQNERDMSDKPRWLQRSVRKITQKGLGRILDERRRRLEQLISVDEAIGAMMEELERQGRLEDTYVIFTSDNGYFRGEHRIPAGKYLPYEASARVPLIIRGPGIPSGERSRELVSLMDVSQTILQITSGAIDVAADGRSLLPFAADPDLTTTRPLLIEGFTSNGDDDDASSSSGLRRNPAAGLGGVADLEQEPLRVRRGDPEGGTGRAQITWRAPGYLSVRTDRYLLTAYANGQLELYDMDRDPAQMENVITRRSYREARRWLLDLLDQLASCAGEECRVETGPEPVPRRPGSVAPVPAPARASG